MERRGRIGKLYYRLTVPGVLYYLLTDFLLCWMGLELKL